jgi:hypothetical protein
LFSAVSLYTYRNFQKNTGFQDLFLNINVFETALKLSTNHIDGADALLFTQTPQTSFVVSDHSVLVPHPLKRPNNVLVFTRHTKSLQKAKSAKLSQATARPHSYSKPFLSEKLSPSDNYWLEHFSVPETKRIILRPSRDLQIVHETLRNRFLYTLNFELPKEIPPTSIVSEEISTDLLAQTDHLTLSASAPIATRKLDQVPETTSPVAIIKTQPQTQKSEYSARKLSQSRVSTHSLKYKVHFNRTTSRSPLLRKSDPKTPSLDESPAQKVASFSHSFLNHTQTDVCEQRFQTFGLFTKETGSYCFKRLSAEGFEGQKSDHMGWYISTDSSSLYPSIIYAHQNPSDKIPILTQDIKNAFLTTYAIEERMGLLFSIKSVQKYP